MHRVPAPQIQPPQLCEGPSPWAWPAKYQLGAHSQQSHLPLKLATRALSFSLIWWDISEPEPQPGCSAGNGISEEWLSSVRFKRCASRFAARGEALPRQQTRLLHLWLCWPVQTTRSLLMQHPEVHADYAQGFALIWKCSVVIEMSKSACQER